MSRISSVTVPSPRAHARADSRAPRRPADCSPASRAGRGPRRNRYAGAASSSTAFAPSASSSFDCRSGATSSSIQNARPWVATTRSLPCTTRSVIAPAAHPPGRLQAQRSPVRAVVERGPTQPRLGAAVEQVLAAPGPRAPRARTRRSGRPAAIERQVLPQSCVVRVRAVVVQLVAVRGNVRSAGARAATASIWLIRLHAGSVGRRHVLPGCRRRRVTAGRSPSSVPTHSSALLLRRLGHREHRCSSTRRWCCPG